MGVDWWILYWMQDNLRSGWLDFIVPQITALGNGGAVWIVVGLVLACTKRYRQWGILLLAALTVGYVTGNLLLKNLVMRARPCWLDPKVQLLIPMPLDYSFPSGHTLSSVIGATVLAKARRTFAYAAIPLAVLIGLSRLYLFVHFPSDVLAGAVLGICIGLVVYHKGASFLNRKFPSTKPQS